MTVICCLIVALIVCHAREVSATDLPLDTDRKTQHGLSLARSVTACTDRRTAEPDETAPTTASGDRVQVPGCKQGSDQMTDLLSPRLPSIPELRD